MYQWFLIFILILILIFIAFYNFLKYTEDKVLYYPSKKCVYTPDIPYHQVYINVNDPKDVVYKSKDKCKNCEYISGWHFNNYKGAKTILFCHGNTGNISHRKYIIDICNKFGLNLFVFDYRGYGKSDSFAYKTFFKQDGEAAYEYLNQYCYIPSNEIIVWGESIGGYCASWIASQYKCKSLILMCTFSSLSDILAYKCDGAGRKAVQVLTSLSSYSSDMLNIKYHLSNVRCPVVIIHSRKDELVPYACSWINYNSIRHENKLHIKIKGTHSSPYIKSYQFKDVFNFCDLNLEGCDENLDVSEMLKDLRTFAKKHNNFMESW